MRRRVDAYRRALARLREAHRDEFDRYYEEEKGGKNHSIVAESVVAGGF